MPSISRIRFTNVVYDNGKKRYIDTTFRFDGFNGILLLENGAGKTVFVQTLIQAVLPRKTVANRKIQETLQLSNTTAHIAVEWILEDRPRRYALTAVSLFRNSKDVLASQEFACEYPAQDPNSIEKLPFVREDNGHTRPATKEEMATYFRRVAEQNMSAHFFSENDSLQSYGHYIEEHFRIIPAEWNKIAAINETEGGVEAFFENCRTNDTLVDRLLIPTIEEGIADENGTSQEAGNGFSELFGKQREHFRQQRVLQKRIEEMEGVVERMASYTQVQRAKHEVETDLLTANGKLKTLKQRAGDVCEQRRARQQELDNQEQTLLGEEQHLEQAIKGCDVQIAKNTMQQCGEAYAQAQNHLQEQQEKLRQNETWQVNFNFARTRQERNEAKQAEQAAAQELQELDNASDAKELQQQLSANSSALHYCLQEQEKACDERQKKYKTQRAHLLAAKQDEQQQVKALRQEEHNLTLAMGKTDSSIESLIQQMEYIEQHIFPSSLNQDPKTQRRLWEQDLAQIGREIEEDKKDLALYEQQLQACRKKLPTERAELRTAQEDVHALSLKESAIDTTAKNILQQLQTIPECANIAGSTLELYQRSDFFADQLGDSLIQEDAKKKRISLVCRQAHRFVDLYRDADTFTADPMLNEWIDDWRNDFRILESGADAYRRACQNGQDGETLRRLYPFWAAAVITSEDMADELVRRLRQKASQISTPLFVLTSDELRALLTDGQAPQTGRNITPAYWEHIEEADFRRWMDEQRTEAEKRDQELAQQEVMCAKLSHLRQDLMHFYQANPFSEYQEITSSKAAAESRAASLQKAIQEDESTIDRCQEICETYRTTLRKKQQNEQDLQHNLQELDRYEGLQADHRKKLGERQTLRESHADVQARLEERQKRIGKMDTDLQDLQGLLGRIRQQKESIQKSEYYAEVQTAPPQEDPRSYAILAEERRHIQNRLDGIQQNRGRLEEKQKQARKEADCLQKALLRIRAQAESNDLALDESFAYPLDGAEREQQLQAARPPLLQAEKQAQKERDASQEAYNKAAGRAETLHEQYVGRYQMEPPALDGDLPAMRQTWKKQRAANAEALTHCRQSQTGNQRHIDSLNRTLQELDRQNFTLQFTLDTVHPAILPEEWQTKDSAVFAQAAPPLLHASQEIFGRYKKQLEKNRQAKDSFITYCEQHIREERRRRHIVDGIRSKDSYDEYVAWHDTILNTIQKSIALAESERKEHFAHIEHIVEHIALYLREIGRGLREIAAKTRIRTNGTTKDIYTIHFNEKKDSEMRTAIRGYLSSLTDRLDSENFQDEDGHEDSRKVKEELQKKLRTQQLLNAVLGAHAVKVKCRKATSSSSFSERPYDWEESNKWSGGEVWCKNMTLFLGCLNYLSEKRARIPHAKYNTRVVVADNPFGKASSDHVLDPVFFIAEQLGFQILALTAHEDGSFVRKYFPIVYSCRFAEIASGHGKVLKPDLQIKTAFFEEHHPETLDRLEQYEEIGLFTLD